MDILQRSDEIPARKGAYRFSPGGDFDLTVTDYIDEIDRVSLP